MDWGWGFTSYPSGAACLDGKEGQFDWRRTYGVGDVKTNGDQFIGVTVPKSMVAQVISKNHILALDIVQIKTIGGQSL